MDTGRHNDVPTHSVPRIRARWGRVFRSIVIVGLVVLNSNETLDIAKYAADRGSAASVLIISFLWFGIGLMINLESHRD